MEQPDVDSALYDAAGRGDMKAVQVLLSNKLPPNINSTHESSKFTALQKASICGHSEIVECPIKQGANLDYLDAGGLTAMHHAYFGGGARLDVMQALLKKDPTVIDNQTGDSFKHPKCTCLHMAAMIDDGNDVAWLLDRGPDTTIIDANGKTAWDNASTFTDKSKARLNNREKAFDAFSAFIQMEARDGGVNVNLGWTSMEKVRGFQEHWFCETNVRTPSQDAKETE